MATLVCAQLLFLEAENPKKEITLYINSPGGVVTVGHGDLRHHAVHQAAGLDALHRPGGLDGLAAADAPAHKGMRFATPNARIMVHQPSGGFQGQASDIERHAQDIIKMKRRLNEIYVKHTGQDYETIEKTLDRDHFMTADEAQGFRPHRQGHHVARADRRRGEHSCAGTAAMTHF